MPETKEQEEQRLLKELEGKNIAYYQTLLSSWIDTRMERDKSVITLSAAAIGLLVTILIMVGVNGILLKALAIGSFIGFAGAIWISLKIYELNAEHLIYSLKGGREKDPKLEKCDKWSMRLFCFGVICMIFMGIATSFTAKGEKMIDSNKKPTEEQRLKESINDIHKLTPKDLEIGKSLSGVGSLSPQNIQTTPPQPSKNSNIGKNISDKSRK